MVDNLTSTLDRSDYLEGRETKAWWKAWIDPPCTAEALILLETTTQACFVTFWRKPGPWWGGYTNPRCRSVTVAHVRSHPFQCDFGV